MEEKLRVHMSAQALGTPLQSNRTVASILGDILSCQGVMIEGERDKAFEKAAQVVIDMAKQTQTAAASSYVESRHRESADFLSSKPSIEEALKVRKLSCLWASHSLSLLSLN